MIGSIDPSHRQVTVIGAGMAGLLIARHLDQQGYEVHLYEATGRSGGLIETTPSEHGIVESAAHSFLASQPVLDLCSELGVELIPVNSDSRSRFIWRGRLRKFPLSIFEAFRTFFRAYFVLADGKRDPAGLTLEEWGHRFLGKTATDYLFNPFLRGIYAAHPSEIIVGAAFPKLVVGHGHSFISSLIHRRRKAGKSKARARMMAPRLGMGHLVLRLEEDLLRKLGSRFHYSSPIHALPDSPNLVLCTPAPVASELLKFADPLLSQSLSEIPYAPLVSCTVFTRVESFDSVPRGVGVLVPEREDRKCLGILFNSSSFTDRAQPGILSFTVMLGGTRNPAIVSQSDAEIRSTVVHEMRALLGLRREPLEIHIRRWPNAIPVYGEKLVSSWQMARAGWCSRPGHVLFGNYTGQVSLRGMIETLATLSSGQAP